MFDIGFSELVMVSLVALLVIGPKELPKAARIAGFWFAKIQRTLSGFQAEIRQELYAEDMKSELIAKASQNQLDDTQAASIEIEAAMNAFAETEIGRNR